MPLSASYVHGKDMSLDPYLQQFTNGHVIFKHDIFFNTKDLSFNKYDGMYISGRFKLSDVIRDTGVDNQERFDDSLLRIYTDGSRTFMMVDDDGYVKSLAATTTDASLFSLIANDDGTISFVYNREYYLMMEETMPWRVKINRGQPAVPASYKFNYKKIGDFYLISTTYGVGGIRLRYLKTSTVDGMVGFFGYSQTDLGCLIGFKMENFQYAPEVDLSGMDEKSWFVSYYNEAVDHINNKNVEPNLIECISGIGLDLLVSVPYETKVHNPVAPLSAISLSVAQMDIDLCGMKNLKGPDYEYSKTRYTIEVDDDFDEVDDENPENLVIKRNYSRISTGTNQEGGYDNPIFSYAADCKPVKMKKDATTFFHYPSTAPQMSLLDSGLREAGAVPSFIPFYADKIFKKSANYKDDSVWGSDSAFQNGQWLCSWLSGNYDDSVWMDRWYNPSDISVIDALNMEIPASLACTLINGNFPTVVDIPSEMMFDPACYYKYFHVGEKYMKYVVDNVVGYGLSGLRLNLDVWNSPVLSGSYTSDNITFVGWTSTSDVLGLNDLENEQVAELNGVDQYIYIPYDESVKVAGSNSFSIWIYSDDWKKTRYSDVVSNGILNYYNLKMTDGLENPVNALFGQNYSTVMLFNSKLNSYTQIRLLSSVAIPNVSDMVVDKYYNFWILDNNNKVLYKSDYKGDIEFKVDFPTNSTLSNIALDSRGWAWVATVETSAASAFDINTLLVSTKAMSGVSGISRLEFDLNDTLTAVDCLKLSFDSQNVPWQLSLDGTLLYRGNVAILSGIKMHDFILDMDDSAWVAEGSDLLYKVNTTGTVTLSTQYAVDYYPTESRYVTILHQYDKTHGTYKDYPVVFHTKNVKAYKFDSDANLIERKDVRVQKLENNYRGYRSDWSGYEYRRKFVTESRPEVELSYTLIDEVNGLSEYSMTSPLSSLDRGWHHFCGVFDSGSNLVQFYIDAELVGQTSTYPNSIMYKKIENATILGGTMGTINALDKELLTNGEFLFSGRIDDYRVYAKPLRYLDVQSLYRSKHLFYDMEWHMPTGRQYYTEEVERFFRHRMPGLKSNMYDINIVGLQMQDEYTKSYIEGIIRDTVKKISPAYTQLRNINWK